MESEYSVEFMLPRARSALASLKTASNFDFTEFCNSLFVELEKSNVVVKRNPPHASARYKFDFNEPACPLVLQRGAVEVFCCLLQQGFVAWIANGFPGVLNQDRYWRTNRGDAWIKGAEPSPEDIVGYMQQLNSIVPLIDPIVRQYVEEGLGSFQRRSFFSAAVMLGAASEKEIYLLGRSLVGALKDPAAQIKLTSLVEGRALFRLLNSIGSLIANCKTPRDVFDGAQVHLASLFESIRVQRNDAVHPNTASVNEKSVRFSYDAFPRALEKAEALRVWFDNNPGSV